MGIIDFPLNVKEIPALVVAVAVGLKLVVAVVVDLVVVVAVVVGLVVTGLILVVDVTVLARRLPG
jgi:hypothetical protein